MFWDSSTAPKVNHAGLTSFDTLHPLIHLWPPSKQYSPLNRKWNCFQTRRGSGNRKAKRKENHWCVCGLQNQGPSRTSASLDRWEEWTCSVWFLWSMNGEGSIWYRTHPTSCLSSARGSFPPPVGHTRGYLEFGYMGCAVIVFSSHVINWYRYGISYWVDTSRLKVHKMRGLLTKTSSLGWWLCLDLPRSAPS